MNLARTLGAILLIAGLLALVIVLAALQYQWLGEVSLADTQRQQFAMNQIGNDIVTDLNEELAAMISLLQPDRKNIDNGDWSALADRFDFWIAGSVEPGLIKTMLILSPSLDAEPELLVWDNSQREFSVPDADRIAFFRPLTQSLLDRQALPDFDDAVVVVLPIVGATEETAPESSFCVLIDKHILKERLIPRLVDARLGQSGFKDRYIVRVLELSAEPEYASGDLILPLFNQRIVFSSLASVGIERIRPEVRFEESLYRLWYGRNFVIRSSEPVTDISIGEKPILRESEDLLRIPESPLNLLLNPDARSPDIPAKETIVINRGTDDIFVARWFPALNLEEGSVSKRILVEGVSVPAESNLGIHASWAISVSHRDGSLSQAVEYNRIRNLGISMGILCLLSAAMILLFAAARRARAQASREREFVASISHELRTPLAVLRSAGENMTDGIVIEPDKIERYGKLVVHESRRLHDMVEDMLLYAGLQSGRRKMVPHVIDPATLVDEILTSRATELAKIECDCEIEMNGNELRGDPSALRAAFENLIDNALRHASEGKWIGVSAAATGRLFSFKVEDKGPGIDPRERSRIFQPFVRGKSAFLNQIPGSGLGLSLVKRIARHHGGKIRIRSKPGKGSCFILEIPLNTRKAGN